MPSTFEDEIKGVCGRIEFATDSEFALHQKSMLRLVVHTPILPAGGEAHRLRLRQPQAKRPASANHPRMSELGSGT